MLVKFIVCVVAGLGAGIGTGLAGLSAAAVISPIGEMGWEDQHVVVNGGKIGPLAQRLYDTLTGIQWGTRPDPFGWVVKL
jgi:branched-chain amino acid aminotransferase